MGLVKSHMSAFPCHRLNRFLIWLYLATLVSWGDLSDGWTSISYICACILLNAGRTICGLKTAISVSLSTSADTDICCGFCVWVFFNLQDICSKCLSHHTQGLFHSFITDSIKINDSLRIIWLPWNKKFCNVAFFFALISQYSMYSTQWSVWSLEVTLHRETRKAVKKKGEWGTVQFISGEIKNIFMSNILCST